MTSTVHTLRKLYMVVLPEILDGGDSSVGTINHNFEVFYFFYFAAQRGGFVLSPVIFFSPPSSVRGWGLTTGNRTCQRCMVYWNSHAQKGD